MAQPNFGALFNALCDVANSSRAIGEGFDTARTELDKFQNFTPRNVSIDIDDLKGRIGALITDDAKQDAAIEEIHTLILEVGREVVRLDYNQLARFTNRHAVDDGTVLSPLRGVGNQEIPSFPYSLWHFKQLQDGAVEALVTALGIEIPPGVGMEAKMADLRRYIGLPAQ